MQPHIDQAKYQPVSYTVKEPRVKLMVHHTGSITIMGKQHARLLVLAKKDTPVLQSLYNIQRWCF